MGTRAQLTVGAVAAVVLAAGVVAAAVPGGERDATRAASPAAAATASPTKEPAAEAPLDEALPDLIAFIEGARGLPFLRPVEVVVVSEREVEAAVRRTLDAEPDAQELAPTLVSLGLVGDEGEVADYLAGDRRTRDVLAAYDPQAARVLVASANPSALTRSEIVRELTRALLDQHFDLPAPDPRAGPDQATAFASLVDGDAARISFAWSDAQPRTVQIRMGAESNAQATEPPSSDAFAVFARESFRVLEGAQLVDQLLAAGGQPRLDGAYADPPTTTQQVLDLASPPVDPVAAPSVPDGAELLSSGVLGQLTLSLLLFEDTHRPELAGAWAGDAYVTYADQQGLVCTDLALRLSPGSEATVEALADAFGQDVVDGSAVAAGTTLSLVECYDRDSGLAREDPVL